MGIRRLLLCFGVTGSSSANLHNVAGRHRGGVIRLNLLVSNAVNGALLDNLSNGGLLSLAAFGLAALATALAQAHRFDGCKKEDQGAQTHPKVSATVVGAGVHWFADGQVAGQILRVAARGVRLLHPHISAMVAAVTVVVSVVATAEPVGEIAHGAGR